jgi:DNA-binding MarR family transcriptional regulator
LKNSPGALITHTAHQLKTDLYRAFQARGFNITVEQWAVLNTLWEQEGVHQSYLAEKTYKDRPTMGRILDLLEVNGLIKRKPDPKDRRRHNIYLTRDGRGLKDDLNRVAIGALERAFHGLREEEVLILARILEHILANLETPCADPKTRPM